MDFSQVSKTAILLLICRVVASENFGPEYADPMSVLCLERLLSIASPKDQRWMLSKKRMYAGSHARDAKAGARKGWVFDKAANRFIAAHAGCTVINIACGLDTRFWRIEQKRCRFIELDLPEVIAVKKELLKDQITYELMGCSVLDTAWIDQVTSRGNADFLLLAEGLFMWLPELDSSRLLREIAMRFNQSQLMLDTVPAKFTRGIWKSLFRLHSRLEWGLDVAWVSGIKHPYDLEAYGTSLKVIGVEKGSVGPIITVSINAAH